IGCLSTTAAGGQGASTSRRAEIAAIVASSTARAGTDVVERLRINLPSGVHVNSNQPRDRSLVPFVVTPDVPAGVTVIATTFPPASQLQVPVTGERLSVFESEFTVDVTLRLATSLPAGRIRVPVRVRYQACDETRCYFPTSETTAWEFTVISDASVTVPTTSEPASVSSAAQTDGTPSQVPAALDRFVVAKEGVGYLSVSDFLAFV